MSGVEEVIGAEILEKVAPIIVGSGYVAAMKYLYPTYITEPKQSSISQDGGNTWSFNMNTVKTIPPSSLYGIAKGINTSPAPKTNSQMKFL